MAGAPGGPSRRAGDVNPACSTTRARSSSETSVPPARCTCHRKTSPPAALGSSVEPGKRSHPPGFSARGLIYETLGEKDKAIADFRRAIALEPNLKEPMDGLIRLGVRPRR